MEIIWHDSPLKEAMIHSVTGPNKAWKFPEMEMLSQR